MESLVGIFIKVSPFRWELYNFYNEVPFYTNTITSGIFHYFYINTQNEEDGHTSA